MIRSMTGFGEAEEKVKSGKITIEIKTVNHKFFDATLKLPNNLALFEDEIKDILQKSISRGKVNLNLMYDGPLALRTEAMTINRLAAKNYYNELNGLKRYLGLKEEIAAKDILALPGVLECEAQGGGLEKFWPKIKRCLEKAIGNLLADREKEGHSTYLDLMKR